VLFGARRGDGTEMAVVVVGLDPEKGTIGFDETGAHARSVDRVGEDARGDRWIALTTIDGRRLVRRSAGAWRDVPIEAERQPLELDDLRADATNGVWVTAHAGERWYLLHDSPLPNVALDP
jgi:hypothetical protein